ncbi:MAG: PIN domain-containing protein [Thermodesulfobacteriota bacterium]
MGNASLTHLLDSVVLIDHFNGIEAATSFLARTKGRAAVSVITRAEVLTGFAREREPLALRLLDRFVTVEIGVAAADLAARLRRENRWKLPDAFQAALALSRGLRLATRNTRDFPPERFSFVEAPYRL